MINSTQPSGKVTAYKSPILGLCPISDAPYFVSCEGVRNHNVRKEG